MSIIRKRLVSFVALGMAIVATANLIAETTGVTKIRSVEGITEYALENGLQVLLYPDQSKPTITVNVTYRVGSRHEGRGEAGMAHLLEHMVFKGTPKYTNIWGALEDHGANFNGTTWVDRTNYFETLPASDENLEFAIDMEADRMVNSFIDGEELAREMTVVRNEFEQGENSPTGVLSERIMSSAFLWHNYGKSTIGNRSDIERVPVDNLRRFYEWYYQPDNATLLIAGKFDADKALGLIQEKFGSIPRPQRELADSYTEEPAQDGPRHVVLRRVGDVAAAGVVYHIPAGSHPDFAAIEVLEDTFTSQPAGRLYRQMVVPGQATSVRGVAFGWAEPGVIEFTAQVAQDKDPQVVLDFMTNIIEGAAADGITQKDVDRAKKRLSKRIKLAMTNTGRIGVRLSEYIAQGDWRLFFLHRDRLQNVTLEDVRRVAETYLITSNRTTGLFIPTDNIVRARIPGTPDVSSLLDGYQGREAISEGEQLKPDPAFIEKRVQRQTLPSGIKVAFLPIETRGDAVWVSTRLHYGDEAALTGKDAELSLMPMLMMRGTKQRSYQELQDEIDRLESSVRVGGFRGGGQPGIMSGSIQSDRNNYVEAIKLLAEITREPAFEQSEFDVVSDMIVSFMEQGKSDPRMLATLEMERKMNPYPEGTIHYVPTLEESLELLKNAKLDAIKELHAKYLGASHLEIAVMGDFDVETARQAIESTFGTWKSPTAYARVSKPYLPAETAQLKIETPDKEMAIVGMGAKVVMKDTHPDYPALKLASYVLGESAKSRLMTRLRHQGGLSYGAGASFSAGRLDDTAEFSARAICAPQNAQKAIDAMREEIAKWIADGLTEDELEDAKKSYELNFKSNLARERFVLSDLVRGLEDGRTMMFRADLIDKIKQLTNDDIKAALNRTFKDVTMIEVMAGDLAGVESSSDSENEADADNKAAASSAAAATTGAP